jgi:gliding motility-associated-like protein
LPYFGKKPAIMPLRIQLRRFLTVASLFLQFHLYGQGTNPGCTSHFYKVNYGFTGDGVINLNSLTIGPDGCMYLGSNYGYNGQYTIIKIDSLGDTIRCRNYITGPGGAGKTIMDYDGNLFSVTSTNYILRTDTAGNILSTLELALPVGYNSTFIDVQMLPDGNKIFLYSTYVGGSQEELLVLTSPDAATVLWTKYISTNGYSNASILADGSKIVVGVDGYQSYYSPNGTGILTLDAGTGNILFQQWFSQTLSITNIARYNNGYIFNGVGDAAIPFYIRTDTLLNVISANNFPSNPIGGFTYAFGFIFQPQADGSVYALYSGPFSMTFFLISPNDAIQWLNTENNFVLVPVPMILAPSGIFIGGYWTATDPLTGGGLGGIALYKTSYSGYFPPCTNPAPGTMTMSSLPLTPANPFGSLRDTAAFVISSYTAQELPGPPINTDTSCRVTSICSSVGISGPQSICTGSGVFSATRNATCLLPVTWSVTGGPANATIQSLSGSSVSISFNQSGVYQVKGLITGSCGTFGDSITVHVNTGAPLFLGNDTSLCAGDSLLLHAGNAYLSYSWQDGSTDSIFLVTTAGQYSVTAADYCGNTYNSAIQVSFLPPTTSPFPGTVTKCVADTFALPIPTGFDSLSLLAPAPNAGIRNDSLRFFSGNAFTYHLQEKDSHGCPVNSVISVQVYPQPTLFIGNDTTICPGDSLRLDAGSGFSSYQWNTGSNAQAIWTSGNGAYSVRAASANGCATQDSLTLKTFPAPSVTLDPDTLLCAGASRQLSAGNGFAAYSWSDGSTAPSLIVSDTGFYRVIVTDINGCSAADSVHITTIAPTPAGFLPNDTSICQYGTLTLVPLRTFTNYLWSDGSTGPSLTVSAPGFYYLQVTDKNSCTGKDSILLTGKQCLVGFYIPNAFTPNNSGKNDIFRPLIYGNLTNYKFSIYNRWGQQVFASTILLNGWDGNINGTPQPPGTYVWFCSYQLQGQQTQFQKGTLLLIR